MSRIRSYASAGLDPKMMGCGPIYATRKALEKGNLTVDDLDLIESNEAFAAQACAVGKHLVLAQILSMSMVARLLLVIRLGLQVAESW